MKWIGLLVMLIFFMPSLYATSQLRTEHKTIGTDSLKNKTLKELATIFWKGKHLDSIYKINLAKVYLSKAKKLGDEVRIADGYQMFMYLNKGQFKTYLRYSDSIIDITKDVKKSHYPGTGYIFKGGVLRDMERYNEALNCLLKAKKSAEINNDEIQVLIAEEIIAELKTILGKDEEALEIYKKHFFVLSKKDEIKRNSQNYISTVYLLGSSYNRIQEYDSAHYYINKGIKHSLASYHHFFYPELVFTSGVNNYHRKKYKAAIDSLQKTLSLLDNNVDNINVRMSYLYLGKSYKQLNENAKAIEYLEKVDSVTNDSNYRLEIREAFELLKDYYVKKGDNDESVKLLEKWIRYEKIRQKKYKKLNQEIVEKFDVPRLIKEKELLLNQSIDDNKASKIKIMIIGCLVLVVISVLYFFLYKSKKDKLEEVLDKQLEKVKTLENNKKKPSNPSSGLELSQELKVEILQKLNDFENNKGFLKNDLTLVKVSKKLKTNSTYLSKVINLEKQKNFTNYINDLRIEYCVEQIKTNKKFRQYAITSMAKEVGFNNIQSFAKAFSKKEGCNPAEYVKKYGGTSV
ncbi:helix-turn-helix domain-containing protein [Aquimarina sediminis]|uniref:helix-turn-helix domain-containing protein n=1 Tax=Aquimarina sediminis TaxID=2070536 RepID=UPI000CA04BA7|nr:helix-turn-helix domain-containing protein [Aquimarina sediminis]